MDDNGKRTNCKQSGIWHSIWLWSLVTGNGIRFGISLDIYRGILDSTFYLALSLHFDDHSDMCVDM